VKQEPGPNGEGKSASGERSATSHVCPGIEVVEYVRPDDDRTSAVLPWDWIAGTRLNGHIPERPRDSQRSGTNGTGLESLRRAEALGLAQAEWLRREMELLNRVADLEERLGEARDKLNGRRPAAASNSDASHGSGARPGAGSSQDSKSGMAIGSIESGSVNMDVVESLKERLLERGRALTVAKEELEAVRRDRDKLAEALTLRGVQVARLLAEIRRVQADRRLGSDMRHAFLRLFNRESDATPGDVVPLQLAEDCATPDTSPSIPTRQPDHSDLSVAPGPHRLPVNAPGTECARDEQATVEAEHAASDGTRAAGLSTRKRVLRYLIPEREGQAVIELSGPRCYVGRGIEANVRLNDPSVSRLHGVLYCVGGATIVEDARSTNGLLVNGCRVSQMALKDGDSVAFGGARFRFRVSIVETGT